MMANNLPKNDKTPLANVAKKQKKAKIVESSPPPPMAQTQVPTPPPTTAAELIDDATDPDYFDACDVLFNPATNEIPISDAFVERFEQFEKRRPRELIVANARELIKKNKQTEIYRVIFLKLHIVTEARKAADQKASILNSLPEFKDDLSLTGAILRTKRKDDTPTPLMQKKLDIEKVMDYVLNRARVYLFWILDLKEFDFHRSGIDGFRLRMAINDYFLDHYNNEALSVIKSAQGILPDVIDGSIEVHMAPERREVTESGAQLKEAPAQDSKTPAEGIRADLATVREKLKRRWPGEAGPLEDVMGVGGSVRRAVWRRIFLMPDFFTNGNLREGAGLQDDGEAVSRCLGALVDLGILERIGNHPRYEYRVVLKNSEYAE